MVVTHQEVFLNYSDGIKMKNFQIIKVNEDSSIKVEYFKTDYVDIPNPDGLKGFDLMAFISNTVVELQRESDFLDPESGVLETLEINIGEVEPTEIPKPENPDAKEW